MASMDDLLKAAGLVGSEWSKGVGFTYEPYFLDEDGREIPCTWTWQDGSFRCEFESADERRTIMVWGVRPRQDDPSPASYEVLVSTDPTRTP